MRDQRDYLSYALAKQVPDMTRGFSIRTSYGDIEISADDAPKIIDAVRGVIIHRLALIAVGGMKPVDLSDVSHGSTR
jgi:hypothetical protein